MTSNINIYSYKKLVTKKQSNYDNKYIINVVTIDNNFVTI